MELRRETLRRVVPVVSPRYRTVALPDVEISRARVVSKTALSRAAGCSTGITVAAGAGVAGCCSGTCGGRRGGRGVDDWRSLRGSRSCGGRWSGSAIVVDGTPVYILVESGIVPVHAGILVAPVFAMERAVYWLGEDAVEGKGRQG